MTRSWTGAILLSTSVLLSFGSTVLTLGTLNCLIFFPMTGNFRAIASATFGQME